MKKFEFIYKCKTCSTIIQSGCFIEVEEYKQLEEIIPNIKKEIVHNCAPIKYFTIGIAELIGFEE